MGKRGISVSAYTFVMIAVTVALSLSVLALTRPWELVMNAERITIAEDMQRIYELVYRRGGNTFLKTQVMLIRDYHDPQIKVAWEGMQIWPPRGAAIGPCKSSASDAYNEPKIPAIVYQGDKMPIPGIHYIDRGVVDVFGDYVRNGKRNFTTNPAIDVVAFVVYEANSLKYVVMPRPYIHVEERLVYGGTAREITILIRYVVIRSATNQDESFTVTQNNAALMIRYNGTTRSSCQMLLGGGGNGGLSVHADGKMIEWVYIPENTDEGRSLTFLRIYVDIVHLTFFSLRRE